MKNFLFIMTLVLAMPSGAYADRHQPEGPRDNDSPRQVDNTPPLAYMVPHTARSPKPPHNYVTGTLLYNANPLLYKCAEDKFFVEKYHPRNLDGFYKVPGDYHDLKNNLSEWLEQHPYNPNCMQKPQSQPVAGPAQSGKITVQTTVTVRQGAPKSDNGSLGMEKIATRPKMDGGDRQDCDLMGSLDEKSKTDSSIHPASWYESKVLAAIAGLRASEACKAYVKFRFNQGEICQAFGRYSKFSELPVQSNDVNQMSGPHARNKMSENDFVECKIILADSAKCEANVAALNNSLSGIDSTLVYYSKAHFRQGDSCPMGKWKNASDPSVNKSVREADEAAKRSTPGS